MSPVGRSILYRCNKNTKLIGASSATCEKGGNWSKSPPECLCTDISIGLLPMLATTTAIMKTATMHKECGLNYFVKSDGKVSIRWTRLPLVATADTLRFTDQEHLGDSRP
ncbi:c-type lectin ctl - selectin-like protein [Daphnia magna]|uniref:C-type lectin ctl-selectin-like protein n=1 Tax=Daphnia magna TaxID=35525 RepID=A0A164NT90_9CRUS|nr:c-type lectin ctl - selectin-like protein [Daphnia magna]